MDRLYRVGQRERQQVVVPAHVARMARKPRAAEILLRELESLEHRAHGAVQHEDPIAQDPREQLQTGCASERRRGCDGA